MLKELLEGPIPTAQHYSFLGPLKGGGGWRECILELWDICTECSSKNSQHLLFWHEERKRRGRMQKTGTWGSAYPSPSRAGPEGMQR